MKDIKLHLDNCKGCFLCLEVCPKGAVSPSGVLGAKGYETVAVDRDKCIGCGSCYRICPDFVYEITD